MNTIYTLFVAAFLVLSSVGFGLRWLRMTDITSQSDPEILLLAFGIGTGMISLSILAIGLAGMLYVPVIVILLAGGVLCGGLELSRKISSLVHYVRNVPHRLGRYSFCLSIIAILAVLNALTAATPPIDVDVLNYHLAVPHIYALHHRIIPIPGIFFSYFPFTIQLFYLPCLVLRAASAAQLLHVMFGLANIMVIANIARRFYGVKTAALATLLFYSLNDVSAETPVGRIDLGVSFYALMAFLCFIIMQESNNGKLWLIMSGIFAGFCAGSKYTGLIVPLIITVIVLIFSRQSRFKKSLTVAVVALLIAAPWYIRNYIWTENPVFPFFTELFGQGPLLDEHIEFIRQGNWKYAPISRTFLNFLLVPWLLIVKRDAFASGRIGPLFLAYLPVFFCLRWYRLKHLRPMLVFCGIWLPFWFWTSPLVRFIFAPLGLLSIVLAQALRLSLRCRRHWRYLTLSVLWLWLVFAFAWNIKNHAEFIPAAIGAISPNIFLDRIAEIEEYTFADFRYVNTVLKPQSMLLFGSHGLYVDVNFILAGDWAMQRWKDVQQCDRYTLETALRSSGITHIMLRENLVDGNDPIETSLYHCYKTSELSFWNNIVYSRGPVRIFAVENGLTKAKK